MSTGSTGSTTNYYDLILPGYSDETDIDDLNSNFSVIDDEMHSLSQKLVEHASNLAVVETSPSTSNHSVGEYIIYNNQLYKVTTAIASTEALVVDTNITAVSVGDQIKLANDGIKTLQDSVSRGDELLKIDVLWSSLNSSSNSITTKTRDVTFNKSFKGSPYVFVCWCDSENVTSYFDYIYVKKASITNAGCTVCSKLRQASTYNIDWVFYLVAIGV